MIVRGVGVELTELEGISSKEISGVASVPLIRLSRINAMPYRISANGFITTILSYWKIKAVDLELLANGMGYMINVKH